MHLLYFNPGEPASQCSAFPVQGLLGGPLHPQKVKEGFLGQVVYKG